MVSELTNRESTGGDRGAKKDLPEITYLFSFAIFLVVFGHSRISGDDALNPSFYMWIRDVIYSFHMHLFMFISGFLFIHTNIAKQRVGWFPLMKKKLKRLMIPYFSIMAAIFLPRLMISQINALQAAKSLRQYNFLKMLVHPDYILIDYYWFLFTLFVIFSFALLFLWIIKKRYYVLGAALTVALIYLHFNKINIKYFYIYKVCLFTVYFWLGCLFYTVREYFARLNHFRAASFLFAVLIILKVLNVNEYFIIPPLTGILFSYYLALIYRRSSWKITRYIDNYSYQIYLLSWFFNKGAEVVFHRSLGFGFYVVFPLSLTMAVIFPVLIARFIEKKGRFLKIFIGL